MPKDLKTKLIPFRVSMSDYARLLDVAGDMPLSAYIRCVLLQEGMQKVRMRSKNPVKDHRMLAQLLSQNMQSRISPNMNQIAKAINCGLAIVPDDAIAVFIDAQMEFKKQNTMLMAALGKKESE